MWNTPIYYSCLNFILRFSKTESNIFDTYIITTLQVHTEKHTLEKTLESSCAILKYNYFELLFFTPYCIVTKLFHN